MDQELFDLYAKLRNALEDSSAAAPIDALTVWFEKHPDSAAASDAARDCLDVIAQSPTLFVGAACRWVAGKPHARLLLALFHRAGAMHLDDLTLTAFDLKTATPETAVLVGYRLCAWIPAVGLCLSWIVSLERQFGTRSQIADAILPLMTDLADEFPITVLRLLKSEGTALNSLPLAKRAFDRLEQMEAVLSDLPTLRELAMTPEMRLAHASFKRGETRDILSKARERSIFRLIATEHHLKYATRTVVEISDSEATHETTMSMSAIGHSMESPLSEGTDPLLGKLKRLALARGPAK